MFMNGDGWNIQKTCAVCGMLVTTLHLGGEIIHPFIHQEKELHVTTASEFSKPDFQFPNEHSHEEKYSSQSYKNEMFLEGSGATAISRSQDDFQNFIKGNGSLFVGGMELRIIRQ